MFAIEFEKIAKIIKYTKADRTLAAKTLSKFDAELLASAFKHKLIPSDTTKGALRTWGKSDLRDILISHHRHYLAPQGAGESLKKILKKYKMGR